MQFKFKHSKITFNLKKNAEDGFRVVFGFNENIRELYQEISKSNAKFLVEDLSKAGSAAFHENNILISFGPEAKYNLTALSNGAANLAKIIAGRTIAAINIELNNSFADKLGISFSELIEKFLVDFGNELYYFDDFKTEKHKLALEKVTIVTHNKIETNIANAISILEGLYLVRDLGNNPANIATPTYLGKVAKSFEKINKQVSAEVLGEKEIRELGMNTFLGVAKGSKEEPRFIKLEYKGGKKSAKPIVLVGKGITFDSGGISIKPSANMDTMKYDMCGAAAVLGVFATVAKLELPIHLIVLVASCENMPSGTAQKPGDIVTTMSGKTVEVLNTDAEGRLILCDVLHYAKQFNPEFVIDVATLTGACIIALGNVASGLYVNDEGLYNAIQESSITANDKVWRMPLFEEYQALLKGNHADLLNIGGWGGKAGSVTAACFLQQFTDYKWAHLDVAGTASSEELKGATGRPFKLLVELLRNYADN